MVVWEVSRIFSIKLGVWVEIFKVFCLGEKGMGLYICYLVG